MKVGGRRKLRGVALGLALTVVGSSGSGLGHASDVVFEPRSRACMGDPPRQTADPLSPPCIPFFDGDNGGSTAPGVTADEITVVLYNDLGVDGDLTLPFSPDDEQLGHQASANGQATDLVRTFKAQVRYFANSYQTFNRRVAIHAVSSAGGLASPCASRRIDAEVIAQDLEPFAVTVVGDGMGCFVRQMRSLGVPTYGGGRELSRADLDATLGFTFHPTIEDETGASARFICDKLAGSDARFSPDPQIAGSERRFGVLYPVNSPRGPQSAIAAGRLVSELRSCDIEEASTGDGPLYVRSFNNDGKLEAHSLMADFRVKKITTVICYCIPVQTEMTVTAFQSAATALGYFPEWYWDATSRMYRSAWSRTYGSRAQASFGMTPEWDGGIIERRYPWRAFKSIDPDGTPNMRFNDDIYHALLILFNAIQRSGPELTTANAAAGLEAWSLRSGRSDSADGGFGSAKGDDRNAFRDRYLSWWFDPLGAEPGMDARTGCVRTNGSVGSAGGWPAGDHDLFAAGWCTAAPIRTGATSTIL